MGCGSSNDTKYQVQEGSGDIQPQPKPDLTAKKKQGPKPLMTASNKIDRIEAKPSQSLAANEADATQPDSEPVSNPISSPVQKNVPFQRPSYSSVIRPNSRDLKITITPPSPSSQREDELEPGASESNNGLGGGYEGVSQLEGESNAQSRVLINDKRLKPGLKLLNGFPEHLKGKVYHMNGSTGLLRADAGDLKISGGPWDQDVEPGGKESRFHYNLGAIRLTSDQYDQQGSCWLEPAGAFDHRKTSSTLANTGFLVQFSVQAGRDHAAASSSTNETGQGFALVFHQDPVGVKAVGKPGTFGHEGLQRGISMTFRCSNNQFIMNFEGHDEGEGEIGKDTSNIIAEGESKKQLAKRLSMVSADAQEPVLIQDIPSLAEKKIASFACDKELVFQVIYLPVHYCKTDTEDDESPRCNLQVRCNNNIIVETQIDLHNWFDYAKSIIVGFIGSTSSTRRQYTLITSLIQQFFDFEQGSKDTIDSTLAMLSRRGILGHKDAVSQRSESGVHWTDLNRAPTEPGQSPFQP